MSVHSFDTDVASMVGVAAAVIAYNIQHWCEKNAANDAHQYEGRSWTYNSVSAFKELFPYLSPKQIRTALDKLEKAGLVVSGNFNKQGRDQTKWYSFVPEAVVKAANCPKGQMQLPKRADPIAQKGKPLPDRKPDNKPTPNGVVTPEPIDEVTQAYDAYQAVAERLKSENGKPVWPVLRKLTTKRRSALKARLNEFGIEAWGDVLRKATASDFLCGRSKEWAADFDFLTSPSGFLKTLEGNYDNRTSSHRPASKRQPANPDPFSAAIDEAVDILADQAPPGRDGPQHHGARPFPANPYDGGDTITLDSGDYAYTDKLAS